MPTKPNQVHVSPAKNGGWKVQSTGTSKPSVILPTKVPAVAKGTQVAKNNGSELVIHKTDGTIQNKNSFGNDPYPPKDKK
jgi:Uncharacterized protein conserved in bacteria (DUF2188)